jgi:[pyruvate, water dikinase]-phosphate phosphotransferase / [pyruvate, water dikinase] kinase
VYHSRKNSVRKNLSTLSTGFNMPDSGFFHLHLISDATGETLLNVGRAASVQYATSSPIEHIYPLVRSKNQLEKVLVEIEENPGIVLYTLVNEELVTLLEDKCTQIGCPSLSVLKPVLNLFQTFLGAKQTPQIGGQHVLNADYFKRIDALNFTMMHDDGQHIEGMATADVILLGISRTSKTPTSIYLANRGVKTANIPLVPPIHIDERLFDMQKPLIIGLVASPERIVQIRQNRVMSLNALSDTESYIDEDQVTEEVRASRKLFLKHGYPVIDVTRRSIEETAAAIISQLSEHKKKA